MKKFKLCIVPIFLICYQSLKSSHTKIICNSYMRMAETLYRFPRGEIIRKSYSFIILMWVFLAIGHWSKKNKVFNVSTLNFIFKSLLTKKNWMFVWLKMFVGFANSKESVRQEQHFIGTFFNWRRESPEKAISDINFIIFCTSKQSVKKFTWNIFSISYIVSS